MGDPKKQRPKFRGPLHPWNKARLEEEGALIKEYGLKNKKEIHKVSSLLRSLLSQTKQLSASKTSQAEKEAQQFMSRLRLLGIIDESVKLEDVLTTTLKSILERRLQTLVFRRGFAKSFNQSRQFITHRHIMVNGKIVTSPSYLVSKQDEGLISFITTSTLSDPNHPERYVEEKVEKKKATKKEPKEEVKTEEKKEEPKKASKKEVKKEEPKKEEVKEKSVEVPKEVKPETPKTEVKVEVTE